MELFEADQYLATELPHWFTSRALARPNVVHPSNIRSALDESRRALLQAKRDASTLTSMFRCPPKATIFIRSRFSGEPWQFAFNRERGRSGSLLCANLRRVHHKSFRCRVAVQFAVFEDAAAGIDFAYVMKSIYCS